MMRCLRLLVVGLLLLAAPGSAAPSAEQVKDVARDLVCLCGTCNRESLATCLCGTATSERALIGDMLHAGQSRAQIVASYVERFGPMGLAKPPEGYDVVWVVPLLMLGVGVLGVRQILVYWRGNRKAPPAGGPAHMAPQKSSAYDDKLRADLNEFES